MVVSYKSRRVRLRLSGLYESSCSTRSFVVSSRSSFFVLPRLVPGFVTRLIRVIVRSFRVCAPRLVRKIVYSLSSIRSLAARCPRCSFFLSSPLCSHDIRQRRRSYARFSLAVGSHVRRHRRSCVLRRARLCARQSHHGGVIRYRSCSLVGFRTSASRPRLHSVGVR